MNISNLYTKKELLFLATLFFAALASLFFFLNFRTLAFPEHNIKFDISREQAAEKSREFVSRVGVIPGSYKETTVFSIDEQSKTYLEREVGVAKTAELASNNVDMWHFTTRFYKPLEKEEISVAYMPNGRFSGYALEIAETTAGARLSKALAQERAEQFLTRYVGASMSQWKLVSGESVERPKRADHTFIWEKNGFSAKDATYRMEVHVYGDKIGGYLEYLKIPDEWLRAYENETSNNDLAQTVAESIMFLVFGLAIIITFVKQYRRNNLRLPQLRIFGLAAAAIAILAAFNSIPMALAGYPTTISWEAFIGSVILISLLGGFFEGASVFLIIAAGEAKFREMFPKEISIESSIRGALGSKPVNKALFVGVFAGIIFFAYEVLYYFLGKQVGFWAPADINYADMFSTLIPWIYPMFIGFSAAATEEGIFRLFGIPFLKKYVKSTWLAIIITSIIWGFLHSNYPQSPWFVRGIEISLIGVVLGWLFVRFGFLANFTAHYTFNALQTAIYFFASGSLYASISSTVVSLLPLLIALFFLGRAIRRKGFVPIKPGYLNNGLHIHTAEEKKEVTKIHALKYNPLTRNGKRILIGLTVLSLFGLLYFYPKTSANQIPSSLERSQIKAVADKSLKSRVEHVNDYKSVITFTPQDTATAQDYILEKSDYQTLKKIYPEKLPLAFWTVRYFKPLESEEYIVAVLPDGRVSQVMHVLDEKVPGANLTSEDAKKVAENYLKYVKGYNLLRYRLVENKAEKQEKRTDHTLVYEEKGTKVGDATFRTEVKVSGAEVSGFDKFLKIPEEWIRDQFETTTLDFAIGGVIGVLAVILVAFGFKTFLTLFKEKQLPFRTAYKMAAVVTVFSILATLNSLATFYSNYDTAIPVESYAIQSVLGVILGLVFSFFTYAIVFGMFIALWKKYIGQILPADNKERNTYIRDALIAGYSIPVIITALSTLLMYIVIRLNLLKTIPTFDTFPQLDSYFPLIAVLSDIPIALGGGCVIVIGVLLMWRYLRSWKRVLLVMLAVAVLLGIPQQRTQDDIITAILLNVVILTGAVLIVTIILRKNVLAYIFMLYSSILLASGWVLFVQAGIFFKINGILLLVLALLPLLFFLFPKLLLEFKFGRMVQ